MGIFTLHVYFDIAEKQHAHSRTAVHVSRTKLMLHVQFFETVHEVHVTDRLSHIFVVRPKSSR